MSKFRSATGWREAADALRPRPVSRRQTPHVRCGICDESIEKGAPTVYVDDERCHAHCARGEEVDDA